MEIISMKYELKLNPVVEKQSNGTSKLEVWNEEEEFRKAHMQHEIDTKMAQAKLIQEYLMKYFVPKSEYDGKFASLSALEIINLIDTIK
jgi:hypothetical protein